MSTLLAVLALAGGATGAPAPARCAPGETRVPAIGLAPTAGMTRAYPAEAVAKGLEGDVIVWVTLRPDGRMGRLRVEREGRTDGVFDDAALDVVRTALQIGPGPVCVDGRRTSIELRQPLRFRMTPWAGEGLDGLVVTPVRTLPPHEVAP